MKKGRRHVGTKGRSGMWARVALGVLLVCGGAMGEDGTKTEPVNILPNGDFAQVNETTGWPVGWTTQHEANVKWVMVNSEHVRGRAAEMSGDKKLMGAYGVDVLSDKIDIKPGHHYRVTGWTRSAGPKQMVFVKGFGTVTKTIDGEEQRIDDIVYQMRKEIAAHEDWTPFSLDFEVKPAKIFTAHQSDVRYVKVLLWAYWPVGTCWYADVKLIDVTTPEELAKITETRSNTFTGEKPRLGEEAEKPDEPPAFDAQQAWIDAANAWNGGEYARCASLCEELIRHEPADVNAHLMAGRAMVQLERWDDAGAQMKWLSDQPAGKLAAWQKDYLQVAKAQLLLHEGKNVDAKALLQAVIAHSGSAGAVAAAKADLDKMDKPNEQDH